MGEPEDCETAGCQQAVPPTVGSLLQFGAVVAKPVGLDHEAQIGPVEVDAQAGDLGLGFGQGKARPADQPQELTLELGVSAGEGGPFQLSRIGFTPDCPARRATSP